MATDIATIEPATFRAGDTVKWKKALDCYKASDGWTLKTTEKASSTGQFIWADNRINGYPAVATNQMTAGHIVFGDWSQVILASFGAGIDVVADPYTLALTGLIRVHVSRLVDVGVRHGAAFCKITAS